MNIFCLNPFFVHFVVLVYVYVLKTVEEKIQSETEALGSPAGGLGESKNKVNCIREAKSQYTNKVCKENSQTKSIFYLCLTCVIKISRRKFSFTPNSFFFVHFGRVYYLIIFLYFLINNYCFFVNFRFCCLF